MKTKLKNKFNSEKAVKILKNGKAYEITKNLSVAFITKYDFNDIVKMLNNAKVNKYLYFAPAPTEAFESFFYPIIEEIEQAVRKKEWPNSATIIIRDRLNNYMGMGALIQNPFLPGNFEIGFQLPEIAWGKGISTLISTFLTNIAFRQLEAYKITADCYGKNKGSIKVLEKTGYTKEGDLTDYFINKNEKDSKLFFGMTETQFSNYYG